jgi:CyaY protein
MVDETTYSAATSRVFKALLSAVDTVDPDVLEADSTGDMVTITALPSGEKVIVNTQRAVHQLWVAGRGAGIHFSLEADGVWRDDKGRGLELLAWIRDCVKGASGVTLSLG